MKEGFEKSEIKLQDNYSSLRDYDEIGGEAISIRGVRDYRVVLSSEGLLVMISSDAIVLKREVD